MVCFRSRDRKCVWPTHGRLSDDLLPLRYKAHFRWQHYPYSVIGASPLPVQTEACASVTSAFLQVLAILHNAESGREESPRNILQILSTNTRRTKVVELSSGTHRVPDELRKHCLDDSNGREYSTNLDRNRYGADNQYLNTVIRYDLDFLGLCPSLVDVEIIDAKDDSKTVLIQAGRELCTCECGHEDCSADECQEAEVKAEINSSGINMLLLAATDEALVCNDYDMEGEDAGIPAEDDNVSGQHATNSRNTEHSKGRMCVGTDAEGPVPKIKAPRKALSSKPLNDSVVMGLQGKLSESETKIAELEKLIAAQASRHAKEVEMLSTRLENSEAHGKLLQAELDIAASAKGSSEDNEGHLSVETYKALYLELEAKVIALTRERDSHATYHSYYAMWVQQLQAEVTNLLKVAHSGNRNGSLASPQLVALTQAVNPAASLVAAAAPIPSSTSPMALVSSLVSSGMVASSAASIETSAEAALRAQYEKQIQELLQQHYQTMASNHGMSTMSIQQLAIPGLISQASNPLSMPASRPLAIASTLMPLDITPLKTSDKSKQAGSNLSQEISSSSESMASSEAFRILSTAAPNNALAALQTAEAASPALQKDAA